MAPFAEDLLDTRMNTTGAFEHTGKVEAANLGSVAILIYCKNDAQ